MNNNMMMRMRIKFGKLAYAAFPRFNSTEYHGHNSLFTFQKPLHHHKPRIIITTVDSSGSSSIRASPTAHISLAAARREYSSHTKYDAAARRLKREDCRHTKYDSAFSEWKILIGPMDWKEHAMGKDGAERYRTHNLPNRPCLPGVYELAVAFVLRRHSGIIILVPVYVGQTENIRNRLQDYGRNGAHLESNNRLLVSDVLSRGFSIVYRWIPMKSKEEAEETEKEILIECYDYAWNKRNNGERRPDDVRRRLEFSTRRLIGILY
ncbi:hypothetical protein ACP275_11G058600 [Erythranthe tilingii]